MTIRSRQWFFGFFRIYLFLIFDNPDVVVFNTIHERSVRKLLLFPFRRKVQFVGLLHQTSDLNKPFVSSKIKKFYVLNDYLKDGLVVGEGRLVSSFYPIFFPEQSTKLLPKKKDDIWIVIPGKVEKQRRDYEFLLEGLSFQKLDPRVKLIFLGRAHGKNGYGQSVRVKAESLLDEGQSTFWDKYVPFEVVDAYLKQADYILPLVRFENYHDKITGTYNLAFAYKVPMLMDKVFSAYDDFSKNAILYDNDKLVSFMNSLIAMPAKEVCTDAKWQFEYQAKHYLDFMKD